MNEYSQIMVELGLTSLQARTLLAMEDQDYKTAKNIAKTAGVARQQIYRVLPELQKLGLVEERLGVPNQYRSMPIREVLAILVERKNSQIAKIQEEASKLLGDAIQERKIQEEDLEIKLITGLENIEKHFRVMYEGSDRIAYMGSPRRWTFQAYNRLHMGSFKLKKNVDHRMIYGPSPEHPIRSSIHNTTRIKTVPFEIPMYVGIFDDKRVLFSMYLGNENFVPSDFCVMSSNYPCLVRMMKVYFETLWSQAQEYKPNKIRAHPKTQLKKVTKTIGAVQTIMR
ncbi:MAG: TrmB family transcriptional regulator [Candidatus Bathyarchaeia archaeon]